MSVDTAVDWRDPSASYTIRWNKNERSCTIVFETFDAEYLNRNKVSSEHYKDFVDRITNQGMSSGELGFYEVAQRLIALGQTNQVPPFVDKLK